MSPLTAKYCVEQEPTAILDLTCLLLTGRASEALSDFLGSGEQMSERVCGIFNWISGSDTLDRESRSGSLQWLKLSPSYATFLKKGLPLPANASTLSWKRFSAGPGCEYS
jgi:hypothetical protein